VSAEAIVTVSAVVVTLVQLAKWAGLREVYGPAAVLGFSFFGVVIWVLSEGSWPPGRTDAWPIFAGFIAVATSAAGVFGFTRAAAGAVTRAMPPPVGAGEQPVSQPVPTVTEIADELERRRQERVDARLRGTDPGLVSQPPRFLDTARQERAQ
jgi:hypothetical protein